MKLKNMEKKELESLSYTDLTEMILVENKKSMNTASIFKIICELLELGEDVYSSKIGDYYTSLTTDKRFILLDNAEWDLRDKHKVQIVLDDEDDEEDAFEEEFADEEDPEEDMSESVEITDDEVDLDDDDMEDLNIIDEDELDGDDI